jgi:DNA-binding LytR/AlgR family response regulator
MRLRALVVEDEWATRNYLVELLEHSSLAEVIGAVASAEDARQFLESCPNDETIDVAFVDIQLAGSSRTDEGLELVRAYAGLTGAPMFVLATAFREHALEAFDLGVVDYLLKPFTEERVAECLDRLRSRRPPRLSSGSQTTPRPHRIVARRKRALVFLRVDEVWAFEAAERLAYVHSARGRFDVDLSLSAIEASIGRAMLRVHRNWLVNTEHVRELEGQGSGTEILLGVDGAEAAPLRVPVARERAQAVKEALLADSMGIRPR